MMLHCQRKGSIMKSIEERFWEKVNRTDGCWLWTASTRDKGYGAFSYRKDGRQIQDRAHRFSWVLHNGPIPPGLWVLHNCPDGDNPACVNPAHLWLGTSDDNIRDMNAKGRHVAAGTYIRRGDGNWKRGSAWYAAHKMPPRVGTLFDVTAMRDDRRRGMLLKDVAAKYGCSISHAHRICKEGGA